MKFIAKIAGYTASKKLFEERATYSLPKVEAWALAYKMESTASANGCQVCVVGVEAEEAE